MRKKHFFIVAAVTVIIVLAIVSWPSARRIFRHNHLIYLQRQGKYDQAIKEYEQLVKSYSPRLTELKLIRDIYLLNGSFDEAIKTSNEIIKAVPQDTIVIWDLAFLYHITGQLDKAQQTFGRYLDLTENERKETSEAIRVKIAENYLGLHNHACYRVIKAVSPLLTADLEEEIPRNLVAIYQGVLLDMLGIANFKAHRYYQAAHYLEKAIEKNDKDVPPYFYLGLAQGFAGNLDLARYNLAIARHLYPEIIEFEVVPICQRFRILNQAGHNQEAQNLLYILGFCGKQNLALNLAEELRVTSTSLPQVYSLRGSLYELNQDTQAINQYNKALVLRPNYIETRFKLNQAAGEDDLIKGIRELCATIIEPEENIGNSQCSKRDSDVGLSKNSDFFAITLVPTRRIMKMGIVARGDLRSGIGPMLGINVNGLLFHYKYVPSSYWHLALQELELPEGEVEIKITYHNNFIPGVDSLESTEDRNLIIEKILFF